MHIRTGNFVTSFNILALTWAIAAVVASPGTAVAQQARTTSTASKQAATNAQPAKSSQPVAGGDPRVTPAPTTIIGSGTANMIPVFSSFRMIKNSPITQDGNGINVAGTVDAVAFSGDGSALTNVPAVQLGGLPASAFAEQGASNTFTADQTIDGNLNLTGYIDGSLLLQGNLTDANGQEGANVVGGFAGNAAFAGNSIAPGVVGATIAGGGGAYDPGLQPKRPARKKPTFPLRDHPALRNPFDRQPSLQGDTSEASEPAPPPKGLNSGANVVTSNGDWATIAGGLQNTAGGYQSFIGGGFENTASGAESTVAGGNGNAASASESTVAGGTSNTASDVNSTVGGGFNNFAGGAGDGYGSATVAGGNGNYAMGDWSTIGGGQANVAAGTDSTVAGGIQNWANFNNTTGVNGGATVGGGGYNLANGNWSTVPGGYQDYATGDYSFAAGCNSSANYNGSFVWNAATALGCFAYLQDTAASQFVAEASGGFYFYTSTNGASGSGATLPAGSGSWSSLSDRNAKANFLNIDASSLLEKLAAMPVATWNYKTQADSIRHLGPTAQDFHAAFGLGEDDKHISTVDAEGVALAGIQALYQTVTELKQNLAELKRSLAEKDREISELRARMNRP